MEKINKYFDLAEQGDYESSCLRWLLIKNLPPYIYGGIKKTTLNDAWNNTKPTIVALKIDKWITFNSKERVSLMIFDIDKKDLSINKIYEKIGELIVYPNYLIETDKGYQFAFQLENHVFLNQRKSVKYMRMIKLRIVELLECDKSASMRNYGFMRNPLASNNAIFKNSIVSYELNDFNHLLDFTKKEKTYISKSNIIYRTSKGFEKGKRHDFLLKRGLEIAKKSEDHTQESLTDAIYEFQNLMVTQVEKLSFEEIRKIAKSVYNYWFEGKIYDHVGKKQSKLKHRSKYSFFEEYGKHLNEKEYKEAVTKRRVEHAKITNNIRSKNHLKKCLKIRQKEAEKKIKKTIRFLKKQQIKVTQTNILKHSKAVNDNKGVSIESVRKFLSA